MRGVAVRAEGPGDGVKVMTTTDAGGTTTIAVPEPPKGHEGAVSLSSRKPEKAS